MIINRNNYNEFFLDYWEGKLSDVQKEVLYDFLDANRDLKEEFDSFESITLEKDSSVHFPDKKQLKKKVISISEFEEKCIAFHEGDISSNDKKELFALTDDNETLQKIFNSFSKLKLQKDHSITFDLKDKLKRTIPIYITYRTQLYRGIAAAAAIIILISMYFLISVQEKTIQPDKEQLSVYTIPLKESILPVSHPEENISTLATREVLSLENIEYTDYEDIVIEPIPYRQAMAIENRVSKNYHAEFTRIIYLDDQMLAYNIPEPEKQNRTLFGRIAENIGGKIKDFFSPAKDLFETEDNKLFWNIAGTGVKGYNLLTNNSYELVRYMNDEGKTKSVRLIDNEEEILYPEE